ncbi:Rv3654c family TadE-like protein [Granulicoccus sp. GXG6511]|uniref:Rv3654c family TadE-like protein n=1 Tax=Granulicoccus sp. GXG6511 TaxID=3381351 RepID=UPI003D7DE826
MVPESRPKGPDQRGSATILAVAAIAVVLLLAGTIVIVAGYVLAARRAGQAADLAAVSAARTIDFGEPGCPITERIARDNGARLVRCDHVGDAIEFAVTVEVLVSVRPPLPGLPSSVSGKASAGQLGVTAEQG